MCDEAAQTPAADSGDLDRTGLGIWPGLTRLPSCVAGRVRGQSGDGLASTLRSTATRCHSSIVGDRQAARGTGIQYDSPASQRGGRNLRRAITPGVAPPAIRSARPDAPTGARPVPSATPVDAPKPAPTTAAGSRAGSHVPPCDGLRHECPRQDSSFPRCTSPALHSTTQRACRTRAIRAVNRVTVSTVAKPSRAGRLRGGTTRSTSDQRHPAPFGNPS